MDTMSELRRLEEENAQLRKVEESYKLLATSINTHPGECLPECDSYGHAEDCTYANDVANFLAICKENEQLRSEVARLSSPSETVCEHPWSAVVFSADGNPACTRCTRNIVVSDEQRSAPPPVASVTRLPVRGSHLAPISDRVDDLVRELRRQGMETLRGAFDGMIVRIDPEGATAPPPSAWQPIETLPKCDDFRDLAMVLVYGDRPPAEWSESPEEGTFIVGIESAYLYWANNGTRKSNLTHWQPLPAPPTSASTKESGL